MPFAEGQQRPHVDLDVERLEPRFRFDAWKAFNENIEHIKLRVGAPDRMTASVKAWALGTSVAGRYAQCPAFTSRDRRLLRHTVTDFAIVRLYLSGTSRMIVDDRVVEMRPGTLFLWDVQSELREMHEEVVFLSAGIPFDKIGFDPSRHASPLAFDRDTPAGRMLVASFEALHAIIPGSTQRDSELALEGFCAVLKVVLSGGAAIDFDDLENGRQIAVRHYLDTHWQDPSLSAEQVCAALGLSRAALYRFQFLAEAGGLKAYLRRRRLDAALLALSDHVPERGAVARIADQLSFADQATFTKQFRRVFGCPPGEIVGLSYLGRSFPEPDTGNPAPRDQTANSSLMNLYEILHPGMSGQTAE